MKMKAKSKLFGKRMELFIACFRGWKEKARHQWQGVAEAVMIAETDVGAARLHASVLLVFLEQEGQVVNPTVNQPAAPAAEADKPVAKPAEAVQSAAPVAMPSAASIVSLLPQANCGACGFDDCPAFAAAIVRKADEMSNLGCLYVALVTLISKP